MNKFISGQINKYVLAMDNIERIQREIDQLEDMLDDGISKLQDAAYALANECSGQPILYKSPTGKKKVVMYQEWWIEERKVPVKIADARELKDE